MRNTYYVSGMSCNGCKSHVEESLRSLPAVREAIVDLKLETVVLITSESIDLKKLQATLEDSLYQIYPESHPREEKKLPPMPSIGGSAGMVGGNYYCPMQCEGDKTYKNAGDCPICGMDLVAAVVDDTDEDQSYLRLFHKLKISCVFTLPIFLIAMSEMLPDNYLYRLMPVYFWNWVQMMLSVPVVFYAAWMIFQRAYHSLISKNFNMFTLIGLGAGVAWLFSVFALIFPGVFPYQFKSASGSIHIYFESATVILTLVLLGQWLEARAHRKTNGAIQLLLKLAPSQATKIEGAEELVIEVEAIKKGDMLRVKPGDKVPVDGKILEGIGAIDESMITGEPMPVEKYKDDQVIAGTVNGNRAFTMIAEKLGNETLLSQIIDLVNKASRSRAPIQKLADKISGFFVPLVVLIALLTFVVWMFFGPEPTLVYAIVNAIAVLIIACPCALGLATPMSVMVGMGKGASMGILIKDAEALEKMNKIDTLVIDKTGTVTLGKPSVARVETFGHEEKQLIQWVGSVNQHSEHPLAAATVVFAKEQGAELLPIKGFESVIGKGVKAWVQETLVLIGNATLLSDQGISINQEIRAIANTGQTMGKTVSYVATPAGVIGLVFLEDQIKETSREAIKQLKRKGIKIIMMTGDHSLTAKTVADELDLDEVIADCLPADKMQKVIELQQAGKVVAVAGDGINDAPALAIADVSIAMGTGTDVAIETASVALVKGDLRGISKALGLSQKVMDNIKQNLFFALIYNGLGVPLAAGILFPFFGILLSPMIAALAMSFSSVSVISNALRLRTKDLR